MSHYLQQQYLRKVPLREKIIQGVFVLLFGGMIAAMMFDCAGIRAPDGGPVDTIPPVIIRTYPPAKTLNFHDNELTLEFNKRVDKSSVEQSIFVSPSLGRLKFDWGATSVDINISKPLRDSTTYIVTIGTDVKEIHNGNHMAHSYFLPFSTGSKIDSASMGGKVVDHDPAGVMIFAYRLDGISADTLNPAHTVPDNIAQTGNDGTFLLPYLSKGVYRVFAIRNELRNLLYDIQRDQYGTLPWNVVLQNDSSHAEGLQFKLTKEDTVLPLVSKVKCIDRIHLSVHFNKVIDTSGLTIGNFKVTRYESDSLLELRDLSFTADSAISAELVTAPQDSGRYYKMYVANVQDLHGNRILAQPKGETFLSDGGIDTSKPGIKPFGILSQGKNLEKTDTLEFLTTEAVRRESVEGGFSVKDSSKSSVEGKFIWCGSTRFGFVPAKPLMWGTRYEVKLPMDSLVDFAGNHLKDSVFTEHFDVVAEASLGSIKGEVTDQMKSASGAVVVTLIPISSAAGKMKKQVLYSPGPFSFMEVPEGTYTFFTYRDEDGNGVYTYGKVHPFMPSERFSYYQDTLKVRARWPLEGVVLKLH
jgi:hypothetical protein